MTKSIVPITIHMYRVYLYVHPIEVTLTMNRKKGIDIVKFKAFHFMNGNIRECIEPEFEILKCTYEIRYVGM